MNRTEWLAVAAIVVAILVGIATVIVTRRAGNRRRRLVFACDVAPLLPPGHEEGPLQVTYRDLPVEDPHLVTVRFRNVGTLDVASEHFDGAKAGCSTAEPQDVRLDPHVAPRPDNLICRRS